LLFLCLVSNRKIDEIYYLQNYKEGWTDGKWEEKMDERECIESNSFVQVTDLKSFICNADIIFVVKCLTALDHEQHTIFIFIKDSCYSGSCTSLV